MKKVLIALDYDPTAQKVAEVGFSLAKAMEAEVTLLHVILNPVNYSSPGHVTIMGFGEFTDINPLQLDSIDELKKATQHFLDKSKLHLGDKTIQTLVEEGDCAESILKTAQRMRADIIVMGSHSRKWLENIVMGSVTEKVLHNTAIPLFVVPTRKHN
ncbi:MAG: universal stress protein [Bacteroidales bacterium]|jgi:nucleotide-binding universal stress UspA family protein